MRYAIIFILFLLFIPTFSSAAGYSPDEELIYRINFGSSEDVRLLLEKGANPNAITNTGDPALSIAVYRDDAEANGIVKVLLEKGANPNTIDKSRYYPIVLAVKNQRAEMVAALFAKGADFSVKSPDGKNLIDIAKAGGNLEIIKMVQTEVDKEAARAAALRTPERFRENMKLYSFDSCLYQYWNYVLASRQTPDKEADINTKIASVKTDIEKLVEQIQKYYPATPTKDLKEISDGSAQSIYDTLDSMVSNRNRLDHNVGTDDDAQQRCHKVSDGIAVDFAPSVLK